MEKIIRIAKLLDNYGPLLTIRQQTFLRLYYEEDLSLGEIALEYEISRQAVHDILRRAEALLVEWDKKIKLVDRWERQQKVLAQALELLAQIEIGLQDREIETMLQRLRDLLAKIRET